MFTYTVLPFELDMYGYLKPSQLLRLCMHSCSVRQEEEGSGPVLRRMIPGCAWMLARFCLTQNTPIRAEDALTLDCSERSVDGAAYIRLVRVFREDAVIAECRFIWTLIDMNNRKILRAKNLEALMTAFPPPIELTPLPRLVSPGNLTDLGSFPVLRSDCDCNGHYSSANYIDLLCDTFGFWEDGPALIESIQIDYHSEFRPGETLLLSGKQGGNGCFARGCHADGHVGFMACYEKREICS